MGRKLSAADFEELIECMSYVNDPRVAGRTKHAMIDIIVIAICAHLCGAQTCKDIGHFAEAKFEWLKQFIPLSNGVPSHDTIARFLSIVDPLQMEAAFTSWVNGLVEGNGYRSVSIDGKSLAGTQRKFPKHPLHLVSIYSHELGLSLAEGKAINRGAGEIDASVECMKLLNLKDVTVMADAALTTKRFTEQVRLQGGHYLLPIKGNQKLSMRELEGYFSKNKEIKKYKTSEKGHGREEERLCEILTAKKISSDFKEKWIDVESVFRISRTRNAKNMNLILSKEETKSRQDVTYYISSRAWTAKEALQEARKHWGIENNLHWVLDVAFGEDDWMVRAESLAHSLALLRKIAFNIAKRSSSKGSIRGRIKKAGWNNDELAKLVFGRVI